MTKSDIVTAVAAQTGMTKVGVGAILDSVLETMEASIVRDEPVRVYRFGTFYQYNRAGWTGVHPRTRQPIRIPAVNVPAFRGSRVLRDAIA